MTDSSNNVVWWAEGSWSGVITDRAVMLLPPSVPQDLTERLWWLLRSDEGSLTHALDELVMGMGGRLGAIPDFVLAVTTPDVLHMALRGEAEVEVDGRPVDAAGITTWFETTFTSPTSVVAKTPEKAGPILRPASDAVVCASRLIIKGGRDQTDDGEDEDPDRAGSPEPEHHDGVQDDAETSWTDSAEDSPAAAVAVQSSGMGAEAAAALALTGQTPATGPTDDTADGPQAVATDSQAQDAGDTEDVQDLQSVRSTESFEDAEGSEDAQGLEGSEGSDGFDGFEGSEDAGSAVVDGAEQEDAREGADQGDRSGEADRLAAPALSGHEGADQEPRTPVDALSEALAAALAESTGAPVADPAEQAPGTQSDDLSDDRPAELPVELPDFLVEDERDRDQHDHSTRASSAPERLALFEEDRQWQPSGERTAEELAFAASSPQGDSPLAAPAPVEPGGPGDPGDAAEPVEPVGFVEPVSDDEPASGLLVPPPPPGRQEQDGERAIASPGGTGEDAVDRPGDHDGRTIASLPEDLSKELRAELLNQGVTPDEPGEAPRVGRRQEPVITPLDGVEGPAGPGALGMSTVPASAVMVQEAPRFGDHDGHTVAGLPEDLVGQLVSLIGGSEREADEALPVVAPAEPDAVRIVLSAVCGQGHPNPTNYTACRECGAELNRPAKSVACPPLGRMVTSSGESVSLDRPVLVGRGPVTSDVATVADVPVRALQIPSPNQLVSRNHILIELDAWSVLAQDLGNCNGTILNRSGEPSVRLAASNPVLLRSGDVLDLGDGQTLTFENLP